MTRWSFVKWRNLLVWHVLNVDGDTFCGLGISPNARVDVRESLKAPARLCRVCDRKKSSQVNIPMPLVDR